VLCASRLQSLHLMCICRWLFWAFFSTYLIVGGYFNLLIHYINNHKWRFSSQAQLLAIAQSVVSSILVLMACAVPVGGYAWARGSWTAAWFAAVAFLLLACSALLSSIHLVACHLALFTVHHAYFRVQGSVCITSQFLLCCAFRHSVTVNRQSLMWSNLYDESHLYQIVHVPLCSSSWWHP